MTKMPAEKVSKSENRRSNKPLMEKRRRARINQSLSELKNLILDAIKKDSSRNSKLEKADILEMAVKHLQNLQKQQQANNVASTTESNVGNKYRAGFNECATEVTRFLDKMEGLDASVRCRLINHLFNCLNDLCSESSNGISTTTTNDEPSSNSDSCSAAETRSVASPDITTKTDDRRSPPTTGLSCGLISTTQPIQVHIPTSSIPLALVSQVRTSADRANRPLTDDATSSERATTIVHGLQLIPTRLSNGEIAFVLDNQSIRTSEALTAVSQSLTLATSATVPVSASRVDPLVSSTSHSVSSSVGSPPNFSTEPRDGQEDGPISIRASHSNASQDTLRRLSDPRNGHCKAPRVHLPNLHGPLQIKEENVWRPW